MGTRHLTIVVSNNQYKVAQYGQWDGYPDGQGTTILDFLHSYNIDSFKEKVDQLSVITEEKLANLWKECGATSEWVTLDVSSKFKELHPEFSRDTGAEILFLIQEKDIKEVEIAIEFAAKSLFCEWAYVIDLDKKTFEVYEGYNNKPLTEEDRFFDLSELREDGFYPVKLVKSYSLDNLPDEKEFLSAFAKTEE